MDDTISRDRFGGIDGVARSVRGTLEDNWFAYLLTLPVVVMLIAVLWVPFLRGVYMSLYEWSLGPGTPTFVGLENYRYLFGWDPFWTSLRATVIFSLITVFQLVVAIVAALAVVRIDRFKSVVSGVFLLPYTMAPVVIGTIWLFLLDPSLGPVFQYLVDWGLLSQPMYWSVDGEQAMGVVMMVAVWTYWPFMFLIIVATLEGVPEEYYESARVYGANRLQIFWHVTLPQLKTAILVAVSIRMIWNLSKVDQIYQLTQGGPGYDTSVLAILLYRFGYEEGSLGIGYAVGIILLLITLVFVVIFIREFEKERKRRGAGQ